MENTLPKNKLILIGLLGAIAVSLGALGAHFLKSKLETGLITTDLLNGFDTAVKYQMYHVIAMLLLVVLAKLYPSKYFNWAYNLFLIGILMFSGSLYFLCTRHLLGKDVKVQCRVAVSFISFASGIDGTKYDEIENFIKNHPKKPAFDVIPMGREGERDICMGLKEMNKDEQKAFIEELNKLAKTSDRVKVNENQERVKRP
ncbi:MAG: DUF423 domain-containing protein [Sphingobacteriaceae bacterium]|nr:DUF423 domain-containing protein [Sphingobacteriaceae bacterium]